MVLPVVWKAISVAPTIVEPKSLQNASHFSLNWDYFPSCILLGLLLPKKENAWESSVSNVFDLLAWHNIKIMQTLNQIWDTI